jgi:hypothetical protein
MLQLRHKLILEFMTPDRFTASPIAQGVTGLQHLLPSDQRLHDGMAITSTYKLVDDTMEDNAVIVTVPGVGDKVFDGLWYKIRVQLEVLPKRCQA